VVGAGIVGLCTAVFLQRSHGNVTVYDPLPPGNGASYGNGGLLSPDSCVPVALPGMLGQVPGWLLNPDGPLSVDPLYLFKAFPWLLRWMKAGRLGEVKRAAAALRLLHEPSIDEYRALLGEAMFSDLIRQNGLIHVWESAGESASDIVARNLRDDHCIQTQDLSLDELRELVPEISRKIKRAIFYPRNGHTVNPLRLVQAIARLFVDAGGTFRQERVMKILKAGDGSYRLLTNMSDAVSSRVVVAAGAWSTELLGPLGISIPLETERGYHVEVTEPSVNLRVPILHKEKAFGAVQMEEGLRFVGLVEIAGLRRAPNERREDVLLKFAGDLLPGLRFAKKSFWMGFRPSMPDSVPVLGEAPGSPGLFIACGHGHMGITSGAISGRFMSQLVLKQTPMLKPEPYSLSRF
jgi:D-amino-acid dehydrogenase